MFRRMGGYVPNVDSGERLVLALELDPGTSEARVEIEARYGFRNAVYRNEITSFKSH